MLADIRKKSEEHSYLLLLWFYFSVKSSQASFSTFQCPIGYALFGHHIYPNNRLHLSFGCFFKHGDKFPREILIVSFPSSFVVDPVFHSEQLIWNCQPICGSLSPNFITGQIIFLGQFSDFIDKKRWVETWLWSGWIHSIMGSYYCRC